MHGSFKILEFKFPVGLFYTLSTSQFWFVLGNWAAKRYHSNVTVCYFCDIES